MPYQHLAQLLRPLLPVLLIVAGLTGISYGLWLAWPPLGWIAAGASCLCAEMAVSDRPRR